MNQNDLEMGDLIFYVSPSLGIVEHTAIYLGDKEGVPYVLHATKDSYKAMMVTHLKNTVDAEFKYRVMRPTDAALAIDAIIILLRWVEHQVPYASKVKIQHLMTEAEKLFSFELKSSAKQQANFGKKSYRSNYSQYLTMVNALPYVMEENGIVEGFGCAESIVTAFNLALLMRYATQEILSDGHASWSIRGFTMDDFIDMLHNPLPFDAKVSLSAGVCEHCANTPGDWIDMGELNPQASINPGEDAKEMWRTFKDALKKRSSYLIERRRSLSISSASSAERLYTRPNSALSFLDVVAYASVDDELNEFIPIEHQNHNEFIGQSEALSRPRQRTLSLDENPIAFFFLSSSPTSDKKSLSPSGSRPRAQSIERIICRDHTVLSPQNLRFTTKSPLLSPSHSMKHTLSFFGLEDILEGQEPTLKQEKTKSLGNH